MKRRCRQLHGYKLFYNDPHEDLEFTDVGKVSRQLELLQNNIGLFIRRAKNQCDEQFKDNQFAHDIISQVIDDLEYMTGIKIEREQKNADEIQGE